MCCGRNSSYPPPPVHCSSCLEPCQHKKQAREQLLHTVCCGRGVAMPAKLSRQRRAAFLGGGWPDEPVSEQVSEVWQLGCDNCMCSRPVIGV